MAYEQKDNSGSIFNNDRKEKDTHPDRTGTARIGGHDYWISGWVKKDKNGNPYMSLAFKPKESRDRNPTSQKEDRAKNDDDMGDSIPF